MRPSIMIQMPSLHGYADMPGQPLSPGHLPPESDSGWRPEYPLDTRSAQSFLNSLRELATSDMENFIHQLAAHPEDPMLHELAELASFSGKEPSCTPLKVARSQAQKILLWQWHLEEMQLEIEELTNLCLLNEARLHNNFREAMEKLPDKPAEQSGFTESSVGWSTTLQNAVFFLPPAIPVLACGSMAAEIRERVQFFPEKDHMLVAQAPLYQILGRSAKWHAGFRDEEIAAIFEMERIWICTQE